MRLGIDTAQSRYQVGVVSLSHGYNTPVLGHWTQENGYIFNKYNAIYCMNNMKSSTAHENKKCLR